jgi:hypothetical protein
LEIEKHTPMSRQTETTKTRAMKIDKPPKAEIVFHVVALAVHVAVPFIPIA